MQGGGIVLRILTTRIGWPGNSTTSLDRHHLYQPSELRRLLEAASVSWLSSQ